MLDKNLFSEEYFRGGKLSNYGDYSSCYGVLITYAKMIETIFHPASIFDAGCAYGFLVDYFKNKGIHSLGMDISDFASQQSPNVIQGDITELYKYDIGQFDVVTCTEVLEHIPETKATQAVLNLVAIAKRYVILLIAFNDYDNSDITHVNLHPRIWWEGLFASLKLKRDLKREEELNKHQVSIDIGWADRFFVIKK